MLTFVRPSACDVVQYTETLQIANGSAFGGSVMFLSSRVTVRKSHWNHKEIPASVVF